MAARSTFRAPGRRPRTESCTATTADAGALRDFVDKCTTSNANAHEKNRLATMRGTVNGNPVHTYDTIPDAGVIFYNHFVTSTPATEPAADGPVELALRHEIGSRPWRRSPDVSMSGSWPAWLSPLDETAREREMVLEVVLAQRGRGPRGLSHSWIWVGSWCCGDGRYWARTSDPQLVELVLSQLS